MFIKLHDQSSEKPVGVMIDQIARFGDHSIWIVGVGPCPVKETAIEIALKLRAYRRARLRRL